MKKKNFNNVLALKAVMVSKGRAMVKGSSYIANCKN